MQDNIVKKDAVRKMEILMTRENECVATFHAECLCEELKHKVRVDLVCLK